MGRVRAVLRSLPFKPYALEIVNAPLACVLLGMKQTTVLLRLAGNAEGVAAERDAFSQIGMATEIDSSVWTKLRAIEPPNVPRVRIG